MEERTFEDIIKHLRKELRFKFPKNEITGISRYICEDIFNFPVMALYMPKNFLIEEDAFQIIDNVIDDLKKNKPIQYITGTSYFCDLKLEVNENVLIPRPETEELIIWIEEDYRDYPSNIIDIGSGSGCIALSLKSKLKDVNVYAMDISPEAVKTIERNANQNKIIVNAFQGDIFNLSHEKEFDIIVSNPPYVRESEKKDIAENVLKYEPGSALFVSDDNPLRYYSAIIEFADNHLSNRGRIYVEINESLGEETKSLFNNSGYNATLKKDLRGKDRFIRAEKSKSL